MNIHVRYDLMYFPTEIQVFKIVPYFWSFFVCFGRVADLEFFVVELFFPLFAFRVLSNPNLSSTNPRSTMGPTGMSCCYLVKWIISPVP